MKPKAMLISAEYKTKIGLVHCKMRRPAIGKEKVVKVSGIGIKASCFFKPHCRFTSGTLALAASIFVDEYGPRKIFDTKEAVKK